VSVYQLIRNAWPSLLTKAFSVISLGANLARDIYLCTCVSEDDTDIRTGKQVADADEEEAVSRTYKETNRSAFFF
jgi:hypothetical protein